MFSQGVKTQKFYIIDFGFARFYKDSINDKQVLGSPHYIAPEVLDGHYGYESDVWSIGIMLYFTIAMEYPFEGDSDEELFQAIQEKELKFVPAEAWEKIPKDVKELIGKMLMKDPISRINIESIPIHSSFKNIHKFEENIALTDEEKKKLNRYYCCSPLQRKFIKFSIKYLTPTSKLEHWEKFLLLDKDNYGVLEFTTSDDYEDEEEGSEKEESSEEENSDEISDDYNPPDAPKTYQMTYSDYLGAVKDPDIVWGDKNIDLVFHTLNPSDMSDKILKKEMRKTLFIRNDEDPEAIREFENLDIKNSRGQLMFSKNWLRSYFANIKKRLTGKKK